jgi:hypothetical protein
MYQRDPVRAAFAPSSPSHGVVSYSPVLRWFLIRAFLCVLVALGVHTSSARAGIIIPTPSGLTQGDTFFVVFLDSTPTTATSTDITTYDNAITTAASGITYPGGTIGPWQVIGATASTNQALPLFTASTVPVYDVSGDQLATTGVSYLAAGFSPSIDQNQTARLGDLAWTGLNADGTTDAISAIGDFGTIVGSAGLANNLGGLSFTGFLSTGSEELYGYALLTVGPTTSAVPEPSTITLAFVGVVGLVVGRGARRCRRASASRPTGCPPTHS